MLSDDKRDAILKVSAEIFSSEGFHKAKITKIAELVGIGAGTVYLYFKNKEAILEELFVRSWTRIENKLINMESITNMTSRQKITEIIGEIVDLASGNASVAKMILHEYSFWSSGPSSKVNAVVSNSKELITRLIKQGMESSELNSKLKPEETTIFIIGGVWYYLAFKSDALSECNLDELKSSLVTFIFNGIS